MLQNNFKAKHYFLEDIHNGKIRRKIINQLTSEFNLRSEQVTNTVKLIDDGNTIPFIARYRKEATGSLSDEILRDFYDRLSYLRNLEDKKKKYCI